MQRNFEPCVYILASRRNGTLYIGVTSNLPQRIAQHRDGTIDGFSKRHQVRMLVFFERYDEIQEAIMREKRLKKWNRAWKLNLIEKINPEWRDLAEDLGFVPLASTGSPPSRG